MTASWHTLLDVAIRTTIVYVALLAGLRLTGTRQLGQMSTFDLVLLLIIANAVQNAMVGPDTSLAGGLIAAGVLIGWHPRDRMVAAQVAPFREGALGGRNHVDPRREGPPSPLPARRSQP